MKNNKRFYIMGIAFLIVIDIIMGALLIYSNSQRNTYYRQFEKVNQEYVDLKKESDKMKKDLEKVQKDYNALVVAKQNEKKKIIYLTFDDGPSKNTPKILDILKEKGVKGTFFVINSAFQDGYKQILESDNALAIHTYTHDYEKIYKNSNAFMDDIHKMHDKLMNDFKVDSKIIRFAGGSSNSFMDSKMRKEVGNKLHKEGYNYFDWNCDSTDASGPGVSAKKIAKNATSCSMNNINLLMHDGGGHDNTVKALPKIIDHYKKAGYEFNVIDNNATRIQHFKLF